MTKGQLSSSLLTVMFASAPMRLLDPLSYQGRCTDFHWPHDGVCHEAL